MTLLTRNWQLKVMALILSLLLWLILHYNKPPKKAAPKKRRPAAEASVERTLVP